MAFKEHEIEMTFFRSRGPGGQKKNVTDSAVRVRHRPSGIVVVASGSRSQHRNKREALLELERRLAERRRRPTPRIKTRVPYAARFRRLEHKRRRSALKKTRGRLPDD